MNKYDHIYVSAFPVFLRIQDTLDLWTKKQAFIKDILYESKLLSISMQR